MALVDLTKQLAKEALLNATTPASTPAAAAPDSVGNTILGQIHAMQKALKEDEELALWFGAGPDRIRVREIYLPTWKVAILTGHDSAGSLSRVITPVEAMQVVAKVAKVAAGAKPGRIGLVAPKSKE